MDQAPISSILRDPEFQSFPEADRAQIIADALQSGSHFDDRASTGRGGGVRNPNTPGAPVAASRFATQLKGAPMGISNSVARTVTGAAKLLGADVSPAFMDALQPRSDEMLGNMIGDGAQIAAGGAALKIPALAGAERTVEGLSGVRLAAARALGQGGKAALGSSALTGLQTGGDTQAMKQDALTAGILGGGLSAASSALKGTGRALVATPFRVSTPEQKELLQQVIVPKMLKGITPPSIDSVQAATGLQREITGAAKAAGIASSPRIPVSDFLNTVEGVRPRFAFPETPIPLQKPTNLQFRSNPVAQDMAVMPDFRSQVKAIDENVREWVRTKGNQTGLSTENIDELRQSWDKMVSDTARAQPAGATPTQEVYKAYADSLRNMLHGHDNGKLSSLYTANHKAILADEMARVAQKDSVNIGGLTLKGANFRKWMGLATLAAAPMNPGVAATTAVLAYPAQTGWGLNRVGQGVNALSSAPAVRALQDTQKKTKK